MCIANCARDNMEVPACAATTDSRTVKSRIRCEPEVCTDAVFASLRTVRGACEGCRARRVDCESSDDSVVPIVGAHRRRRRHRSTTWQKYVKFAAALCVVAAATVRPGGAAPLSRRSAERMERSQDGPKWCAPCGVMLEAKENRSGTKDFDLGKAGKVRNVAQKAFENATAYKDLFARHKAGQDYEQSMELVGWLPSILNQDWCTLPEKRLGVKRDLPLYYTTYAKDNLPALYKYLELITGAMNTIGTTEGFSNEASSELQQRLNQTVDLLTSLLCEFDLLLYDRRIEKLPSVEPSQIPTRSSSETITREHDFLIFRDTLDFLDVLSGVFGAMQEYHE